MLVICQHRTLSSAELGIVSAYVALQLHSVPINYRIGAGKQVTGSSEKNGRGDHAVTRTGD